MKIRGHHLLCLLHFEGKGYSEKFLQNMGRIKEKLEGGYKFFLVIGKDDICNKCPYSKGKRCLRESKIGEIEEKDKRIIGFLGLKEGKDYFYSDINRIIFEKIKRKDFENFCKDCSWFHLCSSRNLF